MIDLTPHQLETVIRILSKHVPGCEVRAFGSRVTWTAKDYSDLDLTVVCESALEPDTLRHLREAFEESDLTFRVDVLDWHDVSSAFQKVIEKNYEIIWSGERIGKSVKGKWVKQKIGSLGRVVTGKTPPTSDKSNFDGPYPFITIPDLNGRVFIDETERTLSEKGANNISSSLLPPNAVMMSCIATIGRCGITTQPSFTNQQINSLIPSGKVDSRFLYYVFTQLGHELQAAGGGGSVYTNVSKNRFSEIEIDIPADITEQCTIAHILGTLDDKIELNRRMNETLEAMARAIFKSWFVD
ncbi:MAG: restriction endonuclease subunit S, partial [bacterium]|nr:restriction endonuclease subunit S [bacterium]